MTALAKSTEVLQRVGMPSILETIMLHKMKLREKMEEKKENNTSHQLPKPEELGSSAQPWACFRNLEQDRSRFTNSLENIPGLSCSLPHILGIKVS